ncbi:histidine kinase [Saccharomonospora sp. NPDC046836]|uniref:sensor histidine kinase n=1 Tax=Saccharomonospora sp. NPDC046836 TaxID=3156921 RepID=UPI0033E3DD54
MARGSGYRLSSALQPALVAGVCVFLDASRFVLTTEGTGWAFWLVLTGAVAVDLLLACPPRWSLWIAVAHATLAAATPLLLPGYPGAEVNNAGLIGAAFFAGAWLSTRAAWTAVAFLVAGLAVNRALGPSDGEEWRIRWLVMITSCLLPWIIGRITMARRTYIGELERRAEQLARDEQAAVERAVAAERSTIARDLHDVISHHVSTIGVHAGAARLALTEPEPAVRQSLEAIESASRAALVDLRRLLDVLHGERSGTTGQPGVAGLDELLRRVQATGLPVRLTTAGRGRPLPGSVDVAVYRVVQEALTNAVRHGDGSGIEIELHYGETEVTVVADNGMALSETDINRTPRGLAGIRQRVSLLGGTVRYGHEPGGNRWRLEVSLPVDRPQ